MNSNVTFHKHDECMCMHMFLTTNSITIHFGQLFSDLILQQTQKIISNIHRILTNWNSFQSKMVITIIPVLLHGPVNFVKSAANHSI